MKRSFAPDPQKAIVRVFLEKQDAKDAMTGLTSASTGLSIAVIKEKAGNGNDTPSIYTSAASHVETITTCGTWVAPSASCCRFKEIDGTNLKGFYELQFPLSDLADCIAVQGTVQGVTNLAPCPFEIDLTNYMVNAVFYGSVTGATANNSLIDSKLDQAATDFWKGRIIIFLSGALKYQASDITGFTPASDTLAFSQMTAAASAGDKYAIF